MFKELWPVVPAILWVCSFTTGCGDGNATVTPPAAEPVPADAPVGEEKPSTDEM